VQCPWRSSIFASDAVKARHAATPKAVAAPFAASLEGFEPTTRCLESNSDLALRLDNHFYRVLEPGPPAGIPGRFPPAPTQIAEPLPFLAMTKRRSLATAMLLAMPDWLTT